MKRRFSLACLVFITGGLPFAPPLPLNAEEMTFVTYYPSPTGNYLNMSTTGKTTMATGTGSTDRVGIGTTNPGYKLEVGGESKLKWMDLDSAAAMTRFNSGTGSPLSSPNNVTGSGNNLIRSGIETNPQPGRLYYDSVKQALYIYTNEGWRKLATERDEPLEMGKLQLAGLNYEIATSNLETIQTMIGVGLITDVSVTTNELRINSKNYDRDMVIKVVGTIKIAADSNSDRLHVEVQHREGPTGGWSKIGDTIHAGDPDENTATAHNIPVNMSLDKKIAKDKDHYFKLQAKRHSGAFGLSAENAVVSGFYLQFTLP